MKRLFFHLLFLSLLSTINAQFDETPRYFIDTDFGYLTAERESPEDIARGGMHLALNFKRYFSVSQRSGFSVGGGVYAIAQSYNKNGVFRANCDGASRNELDAKTDQVYLGLMIPLRFHYRFGRTNRWMAHAGADLLIPLLSNSSITVENCDGSFGPATNHNEFEKTRRVIPQITAGFGYGISTKDPKGKGYFIGPFMSYTPITHLFDNDLFLPKVRTFTVGVRVMSFRVK